MIQANQHNRTELTTWHIRPATLDDLPHISQVAHVTWDATYGTTIDIENRKEFLRTSYNLQNLANTIDAPDHWFYVAEADSQVIGFAHFLKRYHPTQQHAELVRFYVLPKHQNLGIGQAILQHGFAALAQAEIECCFVSVQATNTRARKMYERHGFVYNRMHGQFLGTQIITLAQYSRPISCRDLSKSSGI